MSKTRWFTASLICALAVGPAIAKAQAPDTTTNIIRQLIRGFAGPNWNLFANGGLTTGHRFLLQDAVDPTAGQRSLQTSTGWNVGGGVGVDALLMFGLRASYSFTSNNMNFRTDNGNGSDALNIDDVARLKANTVSLEAMRYMLTQAAPISPYGTLGLQMTWWSLDEKSNLVTSANAGTPFSISPMFAFGLQFKANTHWSARIEAALSSGHNPFTGNKSFRAAGGQTIDEPTDINHTAFRLAGVYHFGRPKVTVATPSMAQHN